MLKAIREILSPHQISVNYMLLAGNPGAHAFYTFSLSARVFMGWVYLRVLVGQLEIMVAAMPGLIGVAAIPVRTQSLLAWIVALALIPLMLICMSKRSWMVVYAAALALPAAFFVEGFSSSDPAGFYKSYAGLACYHFFMLTPFWLLSGMGLGGGRAGFSELLPVSSQASKRKSEPPHDLSSHFTIGVPCVFGHNPYDVPDSVRRSAGLALRGDGS